MTMPGWSRMSVALDAHPLVRDYFGQRVRQTSEAAWKEGHRRVFEHLCESTLYWPEGTHGLGPLYQAVAHGCQAGEVEQTCHEVFHNRILRGTSDGGYYSRKKLGLVGADLGALAWFFESAWNCPSSSLSEGVQGWVLHEAAFCLRMLGRLAEAIEPMQAALRKAVEQESWKSAAVAASNLSELEQTLGEVAKASCVAEQSVTFAERSATSFERIATRTTHADALHQAGERERAQRQFEEAEAIQAELQPDHPRLYSLQGFWYCDLLLFAAEHAAWRVMVGHGDGSSSPNDTAAALHRALAACNEVLARATQTQGWVTKVFYNMSLLTVALEHLTLGRASLYRAVIASGHDPVHPEEQRPASPTNLATAKQHLDAAVEGLRRSGQMDNLPRGLLTRAWLHHLLALPTAAATDLDEAETIASRGPMLIFLADAHLTRARLFRDRTKLAKARELLLDLRTRGYHRHDEMLADAEAAAKHWPA
jgi:tetratricopeptide (TPR) repeat protein